MGGRKPLEPEGDTPSFTLSERQLELQRKHQRTPMRTPNPTSRSQVSGVSASEQQVLRALLQKQDQKALLKKVLQRSQKEASTTNAKPDFKRLLEKRALKERHSMDNDRRAAADPRSSLEPSRRAPQSSQSTASVSTTLDMTTSQPVHRSSTAPRPPPAPSKVPLPEGYDEVLHTLMAEVTGRHMRVRNRIHWC